MLAMRSSHRSSFQLTAAAFLTLLLLSSDAFAQWPSLNQAVSSAKENSLGSVQARSAVDVARSTEQGARMSSFLNPTLEVVGDRGHHTKDVQIQGYLYLPLEVAGQRSSRIREAQNLTSWKSSERGVAEAESAGLACLAYGDAMVAGARISEARQALKDAEAELAWVRGRKSAQDATIVDENLAVSEVGRWAQLRAESEIQLLGARQRLAVLMGASTVVSPPDQNNTEPPVLRHVSSMDYRAMALSSPLLRSLDSESSFWSSVAERASKDKYAPVSLVLAGGRGDLGETRVGAGVAVSFPVLRRNQGEVARAEAEQGRVVATRAAITTAIEARFQGAYQSYHAALDALRIADQSALPAARSVVDSSLVAYRAGKIDYVHVLIARRDYAAALSRRLDLVAAAWRAYSEITALRGELP